MDINTLREVVMVLALIAFGGIVWWAYGPGRRARFERDAQLVFDDDDRDDASRAEAALAVPKPPIDDSRPRRCRDGAKVPGKEVRELYRWAA